MGDTKVRISISVDRKLYEEIQKYKGRFNVSRAARMGIQDEIMELKEEDKLRETAKKEWQKYFIGQYVEDGIHRLFMKYIDGAQADTFIIEDGYLYSVRTLTVEEVDQLKAWIQALQD